MKIKAPKKTMDVLVEYSKSRWGWNTADVRTFIDEDFTIEVNSSDMLSLIDLALSQPKETKGEEK